MPVNETAIAANLTKVRQTVREAAERFGRDPQAVRVLAISKMQAPAAIAAAVAAGQHEFGENYLQEALDKIAALGDTTLVWHFTGAIQSNKTRPIAEEFAWVHTVDREKIARRLNDQRPAMLPPLNVCLEVNVSDEPQKAGVAPGELATLAAAVAAMPRLRLRGLMALPAPTEDFAAQRASFRRLREAFKELRGAGHELDTLSMGMSGDFEAAIAEGATIIRIGTAIFGPRQAR